VESFAVSVKKGKQQKKFTPHRERLWKCENFTEIDLKISIILIPFVPSISSQNPNSAILTNFEVLSTLKNIKDTKKKFGLRNLATITYETLQFLENTPSHGQSAEKILEFLREMKRFALTKNECLMLVNTPPTTALHIQLVSLEIVESAVPFVTHISRFYQIIEDSEERLTDEQVNEILELTAKTILPPAKSET
jgi:RNA polymerase Rpb4